MSETEKKICRYFNSLGGCWFGERCNFLHVLDKRPPCKFFWDQLSTGCRFGANCHFSHDGASLIGNDPLSAFVTQKNEDSQAPGDTSGRNNNNNMAISTRLIITDPPQSNNKLNKCLELADGFLKSTKDEGANAAQLSSDDSQSVALTGEDNKGQMQKLINMPEFTPDPNFQREISSSESGVMCGTCKQMLERQGNESYYNLLKNHYLECFLDKEGDHVKCVKLKAVLEPGQMYWCKSCILIFEKPWSLFQHMADKAKGTKVQRWEKKVHLDWIDSVAGLIAGYDLGLFNAIKLRTDLRYLLVDQHTMEEEMEATAVATAAAMLQWLAPLSTPLRLHQRETMRKMEALHRQILRRAGGVAAITRSTFAGSSNGFPFISQGATVGRFGLHNTRAVNQQCIQPIGHDPSRPIIEEVDENALSLELNLVNSPRNKSERLSNLTTVEETDTDVIPYEIEQHIACASGDHACIRPAHQNKNLILDKCELEPLPSFRNLSDSNNTNSVSTAFSRGDSTYFDDDRSCFKKASQTFDGISVHDSNIVSQFLRPTHSSTKSAQNCGFTDEEVEELLCQGINPWDSEASAALAVLHGEMDHLLN